MMKSNDRGHGRFRYLAIAAGLAGVLAIAPGLEAQAPRDSARAERPGRAGVEGQRPRGPGRGDPAQRVDRHVAMLTERLSLSERQATQIRQILTEEQQQVSALMQQEGIRRPGPRAGNDTASARPAPPTEAEREAMRERMEATRERMDAIRSRTEQRIQGVLTAQQRATYAQLEAEREKRREQRGEERPPRDRAAQRPTGR